MPLQNRQVPTALYKAGRAAAKVRTATVWLGPFFAARLRRRPTPLEGYSDETTTDHATGAVRSIQRGTVTVSRGAADTLWTPEGLERLARTYWRFLGRVTLGLVHVHYSPQRRAVVLIAPPFRLLTFFAPEYTLERERGVVRWRIERGLLVDRHLSSQHRHGHLQIEVRREDQAAERTKLALQVEVANFYPRIALRLSPRLYNATQSRIHVVFTHAFLRSLAALAADRRGMRLPRSKVGRFAGQGRRRERAGS